MKSTPLLLAGSLVANAALVALLVVRSPDGDADAARRAEAAKPAPPPAVPAPEAAKAALLGSILNELQTGDPAKIASRLRAAGLSPATIRSLLEARAAQAPEGTVAPAPEPPPDRAARMKARADARPVTDFERSQYGDIPREKIRQIQQINSDYNELTRDIRAKAPGTLIPEDREKLAFLEKERLADLAQVLSPKELEDYQLKTSALAESRRYLKDQAVGFNATDDEFRAIYRAAAAVEKQFGTALELGPVRAAELSRQRQDAMVAQLSQSLSPERMADYLRATDPLYQPVNRLVTRLELPASTSDLVVGLQTEIKNRAAAIRADTKTPVETRKAQLNALVQEANTALTTVLTPRGFEAYQTDPSSSWLRNIAPRPTVTAAATPTATAAKSTTAPATSTPAPVVTPKP